MIGYPGARRGCGCSVSGCCRGETSRLGAYRRRGGSCPGGRPAYGERVIRVTIAPPDQTDAGFHEPVRAVVFIEASEPIRDVTACYVTDHDRGGTADLGHVAFQVATGLWRIRSNRELRSVRDVIVGYTVVDGSRKTQRFHWDGYDHEYVYAGPGADGSHHSALHQIMEATMKGRGPDQQPRPPLGFSKN